MLNPNQRRDLLDARYPAWVPMTVAQSLDASVIQFADRPLIITDKRSPDHTSAIGGVENADASLAEAAPRDTLTPDDLVAEWRATPMP